MERQPTQGPTVVYADDVMVVRSTPTVTDYRALQQDLLQQSMLFVFSCLVTRKRPGQHPKPRRRYGTWIEFLNPNVTTSSLRSDASKHGLEVKIPRSYIKSWHRLQPIRLLEVWQRLPFTEAGLSPKDVLASTENLALALPALFAALPKDILVFYGADPDPAV